MKTFTSSYYARISTALRNQNFDTLTEKDWENVILNILQDEEDEDASRLGKEREPLSITPQGRLLVSGALETSNRDTTPLVGAVCLFDRKLSLKARQVFVSAISNLILRYYDQYKQGGLPVFILEKLLEFSRHFTGSLDPLVAEKILFDKVVADSLRMSAGFHLIHVNNFRATPPDPFWEKLTESLSASPKLGVLIVNAYVRRNKPIEALQVLAKFDPVEDETLVGLRSVCHKAVSKIVEDCGDNNRIREIIKSLPQKSQNFLKKHQIIIVCTDHRD